MNQNSRSFLRRVLEDERGQVLPMMAVFMLGLLGMGAVVIDVGDVYYSYNELVISTNAAALAGAQGLPFNTSTTNQASINATNYSAKAGNNNGYGNLNVTNLSITLGCITTGVGASVPCVATGTSTGSSTANAIQVTQTAKVPTYFAAMFGTTSVTLTATASALMRGAVGSPYNVAIIVDTTQSMTSNTDTNCDNVTRLQCALNGVQTFLQELSPCAATGCGTLTGQNYANQVDRISLFSFPNFTTTTAADQYDCTSTNATPEVYTFPAIGASSMSTMPYKSGSTTVQMTYQDTYGIGDTNGFVSDYRASDSATTLSTTSDIVKGVGGKSGCTAMAGPSGEGTYYAGVIYAAQAALTAEATKYPGTQNVMILVSDGAATSSSSQMATQSQSNNTTYANMNGAGVYPSYNSECKQAVTAATYATNHGTTVYTVAYGSPSTGCTTDTGSYTSPCYAMQQMASSSATFYSDDNQSGTTSSCPAGKSVSAISSIFTQIASNLTFARLIPNSIFTSS
jgi:Flp pilus assembly protein TadG